MLAKSPCFHSESLFLFVRLALQLKRTQNGVMYIHHWCFMMQLMESLNGYCFSFDLKNGLTRKSLTPLLITGGRNERKRKGKEIKTTVKFITYTLLADDTGSKCTIKPTTLYYYEYICECFFLMLINLLLKVVFLFCFKLA